MAKGTLATPTGCKPSSRVFGLVMLEPLLQHEFTNTDADPKSTRATQRGHGGRRNTNRRQTWKETSRCASQHDHIVTPSDSSISWTKHQSTHVCPLGLSAKHQFQHPFKHHSDRNSYARTCWNSGNADDNDIWVTRSTREFSKC